MSSYDPDDEIYHQVMGVLAPAMAYFIERPGCADANEAYARANVVMAWLKLDAWAEAHGPTVEEAEPEEPSAQIILACNLQRGDVIIQESLVNIPRIEVTEVTARPYDEVEVSGLYDIEEGERSHDSWTVARYATVTVER